MACQWRVIFSTMKLWGKRLNFELFFLGFIYIIKWNYFKLYVMGIFYEVLISTVCNITIKRFYLKYVDWLLCSKFFNNFFCASSYCKRSIFFGVMCMFSGNFYYFRIFFSFRPYTWMLLFLNCPIIEASMNFVDILCLKKNKMTVES